MKWRGFQKGNELDPLKKNAVRPTKEHLLTRYLEGMGTGTARILINRHLGDNVLEENGLKEIKNTGRYFIAKIVEADGRLIDEVLIDKQSGIIQLCRQKSDNTT